jgi:hypothetical protein
MFFTAAGHIKILVRLLPLPIVLLLGGCSGSTEVEEPVAAETGDVEDTKTTAAEPTNTAEGEEEEMTAAPAEAEEATAAAVTSAPSSDVTPSASRVVRYVSGNETAVVAEPKEGATSVATLKKGDRVVVSEYGGWAKLSDGMFVKSEKLSNKAVAPERRDAIWVKPAH